MRYTVILERGEKNWGAYVPDLPGCVAFGDTREETLTLMREAIELHIESLTTNGEPVPEPLSESAVVELGTG